MRAVLALLTSARLLAGAENTAVVDEVENRARIALESIRRARSPEEAARARPELRRRLERALGIRKMPWPPKLNAHVVGTAPRPGYRIEKVVWEALPGMEVPAHLYLPERLNAPAPAILFYVGHWWAESKTLPDFQTFCITMAREGFVVLSFDPFGQGERGVSTRDHRRTTSLLAGVAQQGFAEHETRCALEYLLSRKEVDKDRVGMTGASGGGYNTWVNTALDDRIKVAVPVVGSSEFLGQIRFTRDLDWRGAPEHCHFVPGLLTFANNHEFVAMAAPRPLLIINSATDPSFRIGDVYDYGRELYGSFGMENRIAYLNDETAGHGYQKKKREAAYGWFLKWLMGRGDGGPVEEKPVQTEPWDATGLKCFRDGKRASGPAMEAFVRRLANRTRGPGTVKPSQFFGASAPAAAKPAIGSAREQRLALAVGGIEVRALLLQPAAAKGVLFVAGDRGKEAAVAEPLAAAAIERGWAVCGVDVRGIGELATEKRNWIPAVSLLAGDNFVWRQAGDLLAAVSAVRAAERFAGKPAALYANGHNASLFATYAIGEADPFRWWALRGGFLSFRQFLDRPESMQASFRLLDQDRREERFTAFDREIPFSYFPFGVLERFDLPQLLGSSRGEGFVWEPLDGDWKTMSPSEARRLLPRQVRVAEGISTFVQLMR